MRLLALPLLLIAAAPAPTLTIAGEPFAQADILDARGLPDPGGAAILITLTPAAAPRLAALSRPKVGAKIAIIFDGRTLAEPIVTEAIEGGALQLTGAFTLPEAVALAKRISGKDPLPESLEE